MTAKLQPPVGPVIRVRFSEAPNQRTEDALDRWLASLLDTPATPDERRRSKS